MNTAQKTTLTFTFLLSLTAGANAQVNTPFQPSQRWGHAPGSNEAWIPKDVHFCADNNLVWVGAEGQNPQWMVLDVPRDQAGPARFRDGLTPATALLSRTVAPAKSGVVFGLTQEPAPNIYQRATRITRHSPLSTARNGNLSTDWDHTIAPLINSAAQIATDETGSLVAVAAFESSSSSVHLELLDGSNGALLSSQDFPGLALSSLQVSKDGSIIVLAAGLDFYILNGSGQVLHQQALNSAPSATAVSGDGSRVAVGSTGQLVVLTAGSNGWGALITLTRSQTDVVTALDLSQDGETLAVAWWRYTTGTWARYELRQNAVLVAQHEQSGGIGARQNMPSIARITPDGRRAAYGAWGDGMSPEVILLEAGLPQPVWEIDVPGSVTGLDLDESGTRIVVAHKDVHVSTFGSTGGIRLFDTGEGDLRQNNPMTIGGIASFSTKRQNSLISLLLVGQRAPAVALPGVGGLLYLDRSTLAVLPAASDLDGIADHQFSIPSDVALIGTTLSLQSAFRLAGATELGEWVLDPLIF